MKNDFLIALIAGGLLAGCATEERIMTESAGAESAVSVEPSTGTEFSELPLAVQRAIQANAPDAQIDDIDMEQRSGRTVYEVTFQEPGENPKMHISEDGIVLNVNDVETDLTFSSEPAFGTRVEDLPIPAQNAIRASAGAAEIDDIDKETRTGRTVYEVTFKDEGQNPKMHVAADGTILSEDDVHVFAVQEPSLGTERADLPAAVSQAIQAYAPGAEIDDIDRETRTGRTLYEITFKNPGQNPKLHITSDGQMLTDNEAKLFFRSEPAFVETAETPSVGTKFRDLPQAVKNRIRTEVGIAEIRDIRVETSTGATVYEVTYVDKGENELLHIASNGTLVGDPHALMVINEPAGAPLHRAVWVGPRIDDLPAAVQNTLRAEAVGRMVSDIDVEHRTGRAIYEIQFEEPGLNPKLHIDQDGAILDW